MAEDINSVSFQYDFNARSIQEFDEHQMMKLKKSEHLSKEREREIKQVSGDT